MILYYLAYLPPRQTPWYLRGTVFTADIDRATRYSSHEEARAAKDRCRKFHRASIVRQLVVQTEWIEGAQAPAQTVTREI